MDSEIVSLGGIEITRLNFRSWCIIILCLLWLFDKLKLPYIRESASLHLAV